MLNRIRESRVGEVWIPNLVFVNALGPTETVLDELSICTVSSEHDPAPFDTSSGQSRESKWKYVCQVGKDYQSTKWVKWARFCNFLTTESDCQYLLLFWFQRWLNGPTTNIDVMNFGFHNVDFCFSWTILWRRKFHSYQKRIL